MGVGTAISAGLGGASLLGGLMGGGGKGGGGGGSTINVQPSPYEQQMAQMSQEYWNQTSPLREAMISDYMGFLRPGGSYTTSSYSPGSTSTTGAYNTGYSGVQGGQDVSKQFGYIGANPWAAGQALFNPATGRVENQPGLTQLTGMSQADIISKYGNPPPSEIGVSGSTLGEMSPAYRDWLSKIEQDVSMDQRINQAIQQAQLGQQTQTGTTTTPTGFTSSNLYNPYNLPGYAPLYQLARTGLESQYNPARQSIMESTPRGGALYENLANLEMGRAQQAGSLPATIAAPLISDIMNKAYGVAFNSPQTSIAGLGAASNSWNATQGLSANAGLQSALLNRQSAAATASGLGSLAALGVAGAGGLGGKSPFKGATASGGLSGL